MYQQLYAALRDLKDTGGDGFEGFVKALLEAFVPDLGFFFIAKSGYQGGLDASNVGFLKTWVALECKHYEQTSQLRSVELNGALTLAINNSNQQLDLWVLATTKGIGANEIKDLKETADRECVGLVALDWQTAGLPKLGVMCAAVSSLSLLELTKRTKNINGSGIQADLDSIQNHPSFSAAKSLLIEELSAVFAGYDRARFLSENWILQNISSHQKAYTHHNQSLCPLDSAFSPYIERKSVSAQLNAWWKEWGEQKSLAVVKGREGVGKSWAVMKWWQSLPNKPLTLLVTSNFPFVSDDPLEILADFLSKHIKSKSAQHWRKSLERWLKRQSSQHPLVLVVFDGINEQSREHWERRIASFSEEHLRSKIGIIMTSWPEYWSKNVERNMLVNIATKEVSVNAFSQTELREALEKKNLNFDEIDEGIRSFISVPRIFHLSVNSYPHLLKSKNLTWERLAIEDWQSRKKTKQLQHSDRQFNEIIIALAKDIRAGIQQFSPHKLREISSLAKKSPDRNLDRDFDEIIAGRLFEIIDEQSETYRIRQEYVSLSLGMLIAEEVRNVASLGTTGIQAAIDQAIDPFRDFSSVNGIVAGAVACACFWPGYPIGALELLLQTWLRLRNRSNENFQDFSAYVIDKPEAYLKVAEVVWCDMTAFPDGREWVSAAILRHLDRPEVFALVVQYANRWLSTWHTDWHPFLGQADEKDLLRQRERFSKKWDSMSQAEQTLCNSKLVRSEHPIKVHLADFAFILISHSGRLSFVNGIFNWALSRTLMSLPIDFDVAAWCLRLNTRDFLEVEAELLQLLQRLPVPNTEFSKNVSELIRRAIGTGSAVKELPVRSIAKRSAGVAEISEQSLNPNFTPPNIDAFVKRLNELDINQVHSCMSQTTEDWWIRESLPCLAAFGPDELIKVLRKILGTFCFRSGVSLRQLSWFALRHTLLIDEPIRKSIEDAYKRFTQSMHLLNEQDDNSFIESNMLVALMAVSKKEEQLPLLQSRPPKSSLRLSLYDLFKAHDSASANEILSKLSANDDIDSLRNTLFYLQAQKFTLEKSARTVLMGLLQHPDSTIRSLAFELGNITNDKVVADEHANSSWRSTGQNNSEDFYGTKLLAISSNANLYSKCRRRATPELLGWLAMKDGSADAVAAFAEDLDSMWQLITTKDIAERAKNEMLVIESGQSNEPVFNFVNSTKSLKAIYKASQAAFLKDASQNLEILNSDALEKKLKEEYEQLNELIERAQKLGAKMFGKTLRAYGLTEVIQSRPDLLSKWMDRLNSAESVDVLWRAGEFYRAIAHAIGQSHPKDAAIIMRKLREADGFSSRTVFQPMNVDALLYTTFRVGGSEGLDLRNYVLEISNTDEALFQIALVTQDIGELTWLESVIDEGLRSQVLYYKARSLTLIGFLNDYSSLTKWEKSLEGHLGFLAEVAETSKHRIQQNRNAKHWMGEFVKRDNLEAAWAALQLAIRCLDRRYFLWKNGNVDEALTVPKRISLDLNEDTIVKAMKKNEGTLETTLFGVKICKGDLYPWC